MGLYLAGALMFPVYDVTPSVVAATLFNINESEEALNLTEEDPDSAVGIATGCGLDDRGVGVPSPGRGKILLLSKSSKPVLGSTQLPI
jgi:hypothetical protein